MDAMAKGSKGMGGLIWFDGSPNPAECYERD